MAAPAPTPRGVLQLRAGTLRDTQLGHATATAAELDPSQARPAPPSRSLAQPRVRIQQRLLGLPDSSHTAQAQPSTADGSAPMDCVEGTRSCYGGFATKTVSVDLAEPWTLTHLPRQRSLQRSLCPGPSSSCTGSGGSAAGIRPGVQGKVSWQVHGAGTQRRGGLLGPGRGSASVCADSELDRDCTCPAGAPA